MSSEDDKTISAAESTPSAAHLGQLAPGQLFAERYEVEAPIGRGGMGAVYRVRDRKLDEVVALKLLTLDTERAVEGFLREVRLARRVTHPNVARTHDLGEHAGAHFLTMEYVRGTALDRLLADAGKLEPKRAASIGEQIAAGLDAAHAAGVIHRDLKPGNVLIAEGGRVLITDFGIARAARVDPNARETGVLTGTPHYMAPEQVIGAPIDARADIYALGIILFELITGRLPFEGESPMAVALMRVHQAPADPRTFGPVPDSMAELIGRCLAREPEGRPTSADEVRVALAHSTHAPSTGDLRRSTPSLFAPMSLGRRAVAVLPFIYRGDAEQDYLGEGLAEELIDLLSRTKGLRVLALGATRKFSDQRDPARIGMELGADVIVDGTVQLAGDRVRIAARLVDTDGSQRWSERFDGRFEDVFTLQESMGKRIAESLRLEIDAAAFRRSAPQEAIELYLRARRLLRTDMMTRAPEALSMFERCLELAPDFTPAFPAHAMAAVRTWWSSRTEDGQARAEHARQSVATASERAPDAAETHLARAMLASQNGVFREAAQALAKALEIAPTLAEAHHLLAELQVEAGRLKEGKGRAKLALELDPSLVGCHVALSRAAALEKDFATADLHLDLVEERSGLTMATGALRLRYTLWRGGRDEARAVVQRLSMLALGPAQGFAFLTQVALGEIAPAEALLPLSEFARAATNPRFTSLARQFGVEVLAAAGAHTLALDVLTQAADAILIDLEWMRRCPLLEPLRGSEAFAASISKVEQRTADMWRR